MFDNYQICPYTGLRSFSEEESLYFKGREEDIEQATSQLQKNKFLMLTGASGDGKSSLVYAGIIPNARAGFLKSKYTNWCVAGFRPERSPFQNLAGALTKQLDIPSSYTVQGELNHGFSALVDLYKNSKRFIDIHSDAWLKADEKEKAKMKREAANLIVLVDQFEELFTNPENYHQGVPSKDANLVLNLLLETARIALEEDIPIYVIFTMRSDYIGQCAAFRGLPEYIGFSQFFVPRLNRSQLQQVIEEPATLSGNRINRRLTERLIHDLTEGVDQLPILQHALKQIWIAADNGIGEMDLIHYAMVGGMPVNELPDEQVKQFNDWFSLLTAEIKACYHAPSLQNVLDTHMNKLYEQAAGYYLANTGKAITDADAKKIIRTAFTCLTKIDQSRAVRNRMTLQEITHILGNPEFDNISVGALLNIFREPGNTFINPFISEDDPDSRQLHTDTVLDITHESLIRNWQWLGQWAKDEYDSYSVSLDFEKQLDRWVNSDKSNNYLLSIGPLTYFEDWYNKAKPNAWWLARYLPEETNNETRQDNAVVILNNSREFIKRSARKHAITRTIMRYGPKRIGAVLGIALVGLSSFIIRNHIEKQNSYVLDNIRGQTLKLAADPRVPKLSKSLMVIEELRQGDATLEDVMNSVNDPVQRISVMNTIASMLVFQGRDEPSNEISRSFFLTDSLMNTVQFPDNDANQMVSLLKEINFFRIALEIAYFYHPDDKIGAFRQKNALRSAKWVKKILELQPAGFSDIQGLNLALENAINYHSFTSDELSQLVKLLSPFENGLNTDWLKSSYQKDKILRRGSEAQSYGFKYNGLYQELAYLYAAIGDSEKGLRCLDSLLANSQNNFQGDYAAGGDNATNIVAVYFNYDKTDAQNIFVKGYCTRKKSTEEDFYNRLIARTYHGLDAANNLRIYPFMDETLNVNLKFCSRKQLSAFFTKYRETVQTTISDADQRNYLLALSYKNEGMFKSINSETSLKGEPDVNGYFDKAMVLYRSLDPNYLNSSISITVDASDIKIMPRKYLFVYPDFITPFHPAEPRSYFQNYLGDAFMNYIVSNQLVNSFYTTYEEMGYLVQWLEFYNTTRINPSAFMVFSIRNQVLKNLEVALRKNDSSKRIDLNWLYLYLGKDAQDSGKLEEMVGYYDAIEFPKIFNLMREKDYFGFVRDQSFRMIAIAVEGYMKAGHPAQAYRLVSQFKNPSNRSSLYAYAAINLLKEKADDKTIHLLLDSALAEMDRKENRTNNQPNRGSIAYALTLENPSENTQKAYALIRNLWTKFEATRDICRAFAFRKELFGAEENIPAYISASDQADFLWAILLGYSEGELETRPGWKKFELGYPPRLNANLQYVDENN